MKLIVIGFIGSKQVYVNMSKEEAILKYNEENPEFTVEKMGFEPEEMEVGDTFMVYDIWTS